MDIIDITLFTNIYYIYFVSSKLHAHHKKISRTTKTKRTNLRNLTKKRTKKRRTRKRKMKRRIQGGFFMTSVRGSCVLDCKNRGSVRGTHTKHLLGHADINAPKSLTGPPPYL